MGPVEVAVLGNHLRLDPEAKGKTHLVNPLGKPLQAVLQLGVVHSPVPQAAAVIVPLSEPAVIQDEQVHAHLQGTLGNIQKLFLVKIKVGCLPAVDDNRAGLLHIGGAAQIVPEYVMIKMA